MKEDKQYHYINDLQAAVIERRLRDEEPVMRQATLSPGDPRRIAKTIAPVAPEDTSKIVFEHKSRGLRKAKV